MGDELKRQNQLSPRWINAMKQCNWEGRRVAVLLFLTLNGANFSIVSAHERFLSLAARDTSLDCTEELLNAAIRYGLRNLTEGIARR